MSFTELGLAPALCTPLSTMGYTRPTPVQHASIPLVLSGADVMARAQTGTGKTAAFGLPMIQRLVLARRRSPNPRPLGLVLVPTRELCVQVQRDARDLRRERRRAGRRDLRRRVDRRAGKGAPPWHPHCRCDAWSPDRSLTAPHDRPLGDRHGHA